jgi:NAD-dependent DNA ligase
MDVKERNFLHHEVWLLYHKYLYYELSKPIIEDHVFDSALIYGEKLYQYVNEDKYPLNETVFYMVGFDYNSKYWEECKQRFNID